MLEPSGLRRVLWFFIIHELRIIDLCTSNRPRCIYVSACLILLHGFTCIWEYMLCEYNQYVPVQSRDVGNKFRPSIQVQAH